MKTSCRKPSKIEPTISKEINRRVPKAVIVVNKIVIKNRILKMEIIEDKYKNKI